MLSGDPDGAPAGSVMSGADPVSGLAYRLSAVRAGSATRYIFEMLYGADIVRPELGACIAG